MKVFNLFKLIIILISTNFLFSCSDTSKDQPKNTASVSVYTSITTFSENAGSGSFSVVLDTEPTNLVIVNIESQDMSEASTDVSQLTFDTNNWNIAQTVSITGIDDDDADGNQTFNIALEIDAATTDTTGFADLMPSEISDVSVTVTDDDITNVTLTPDQLSISENNGSSVFNVVLNSQPNGTVIIDLASDAPNAMSLNQTQLTFDETSWNVAQAVTAIAINNDIVSGNQTAHATLNINDLSTDSSGYKLMSLLPGVTVTLIDDDEPAYTLMPNKVSFSESAGQGSIDVVLNSEPDGNVVLLFSSSNTNNATVTNSNITFTPINWNQEQTVNLLGVDNSLNDGNQEVMITASIEASTTDSTGYAVLSNQTITVVVTDDDEAGVTISSPNGTTITEVQGATNSIILNVVLNTLPDGNVVIDVSNTNSDRSSLGSNQITFTTNDWSTPQTISITAIDNALDDGDITDQVQFQLNASTTDTTGYQSLTLNEVFVSVIDDDTAGFSLTPIVSSLSENNGAGSFSISLQSQPDSNVDFLISSGDANDVTVSNPNITFTAQNWSDAQTVMLSGVNNNSVDGDRLVSINAAISSTADTTGYALLANKTVDVTVTDDDVNGVTISTPNGTTITESAGVSASATATLKLNTQPNGNVIIDITNTDVNELTADASQLTFTSSNWDTEQTINISSINDAVDDGDSTTAINFSVNAFSVDTTGYATTNINGVSFTVTDDDTRNVIISPSSLTIDEASSDSFSVVLGSEPSTPVSINFVANTNSDEVILSTALTFSATNWNVAQTYSVSAVDDQIQDGNVIVPLTVTVTPATQSEYSGLSIPAVSVTTVDNQPLPITLFNAGTSNGNLGGRSGADATCASVAQTVQACANKPNVHAFLSTSWTADNIIDMPANYGYNAAMPVVGPTGLTIANTWSDLFVSDGSTITGSYLQRSLASAAVLPANQIWWGGSWNAKRNFDSPLFHCAGFTTASSASQSYVSTSSNVDIRWILKGTITSANSFAQDESYTCNNTSYLVCSCGN